MTTLTTSSNKIEVQSATMGELVEFYTATTGKAIKKFETRAKGVDRCLQLLTTTTLDDRIEAGKKSGRVPTTKADLKAMITPEPSAMGAIAKTVTKVAAPAKRAATKTAPKPAAKKAKSAPAEGRGRAHFSESGVITIVHKGDNPKRGTAAERYDLYRSGMTVAAYIAAGGQRRDVVWDQKMGWITVKG
jgi:hypothetical protein